MTTLDVRLMGRKYATSLGDLSALSNGMMMATFKTRRNRKSENDELNMDNNSWRAKAVFMEHLQCLFLFAGEIY